jgi:hypothetical protein
MEINAMKDQQGRVVLDAERLCESAQRYYYYSAPLLGDEDPCFPHAGDGIRARGCVLREEFYDPVIDDGVKVTLMPLQEAGLLRLRGGVNSTMGISEDQVLAGPTC